MIYTSWWLNQPIWKICSSNWIISPKVWGENQDIENKTPSLILKGYIYMYVNIPVIGHHPSWNTKSSPDVSCDSWRWRSALASSVWVRDLSPNNTYCWWKKSGSPVEVGSLNHYQVLYIPSGAGLLPLTVGIIYFPVFNQNIVHICIPVTQFWPLFWWDSWPCFRGLTFKNRGHY